MSERAEKIIKKERSGKIVRMQFFDEDETSLITNYRVGSELDRKQILILTIEAARVAERLNNLMVDKRGQGQQLNRRGE